MTKSNGSPRSSSVRRRTWLTQLAFLASLSFTATSSNAGLITSYSAGSTEKLGSFTGFIGVSNNTTSPFAAATITAQLTNTSPVDDGGFITGFVFNNPDSVIGGDISGVTLATTTDPDFVLLGGTQLSDPINGSPFGSFDIGAALSGANFLGRGGAPSQGIGVGESATFTFNVTGTNLQNLSQTSLEAALSSNPGGGGSQFFLVRFRGIEAGKGSDKVPGMPAGVPVPEPGTITMALIGSIPLGLMAWRRRKRAVA